MNLASRFGILVIGFVVLANFLLVGCQQQPTKVYQTVPTQVSDKVRTKNIVPTLQTVIIDARPAFEFAISHLNGAINLRPEDFNQQEAPFRGVLEKDKFYHARRLARLGIAPDTHVVVVGRGAKGQGEEGRIAWMLKHFGVQNVEFCATQYFSLPLTSNEAPPRLSLPIWKPNLDESLVVEKEDFLRATKVPAVALSSVLILDIRPEEEYLGKAKVFKRNTPVFSNTINIPWTQFFDEQGLVKADMKEKLNAVGISSMRIIYVIGNMGAESAAVTLALRELGFNKSANFAGGYNELVNSK